MQQYWSYRTTGSSFLTVFSVFRTPVPGITGTTSMHSSHFLSIKTNRNDPSKALECIVVSEYSLLQLYCSRESLGYQAVSKLRKNSFNLDQTVKELTPVLRYSRN